MAHFCLLVVTHSPEDVREALLPYWDDDMEGREQPHFIFIEDPQGSDAPPDPRTGRPGYWKNPIGKWDGWVEGGRWAGLLAPVDGPWRDEAQAGDTGNRCRAGELTARLLSRQERLAEIHALLVHGIWRDASETKAAGGDWREELMQALRNLSPSDCVTLIDCHC